MSDARHLKNILILDDDADFRKLLITILGKRFEDVSVTEYDPVDQGIPDDHFNWSKYDVLLLDYHLSIPRTTGLDILQNNRKNRLFPATIMLTGAGNEEVAVRAVKAGVYDYMRKEYLDKERLQNAILEAFEKHQVECEKLNELTSQSHAFNKALFYQELEQSDRDKYNRVLLLIELDQHEKIERQHGIIFRDSVIRHIAKQSFDVFRMADSNPSITRFGDASVAMLIDEPKSKNALEFNLEGLCAHLEKHPYRFDGKKASATVSVGALCLSDKRLNAEDYINHALIAAGKAAEGDGDSFYLYKDADWEALPERPARTDVVTELDEETPVPPTGQQQPGPDDEPEPATEQAREPASGDETTAPAGETGEAEKVEEVAEAEEAEEQSTAPAPETKETKLDSRQLAELLQSIKTAFEEKRAVPTFQPVISLTHEDDDQDIYMVSVQLIHKDGSIIPPEELQQVAGVPAFRKFLDRWMLREIIGRLVNRQHEQYIFFLNLSAESISDATFFNWLRKLLKGLNKNDPGKQIFLEINANDVLNTQKQTAALMSFLKKSHGFRFILGHAKDIQQLQDLSTAMHFDVIRADFETFSTMSTTYPESTGNEETETPISQLQQLKDKDIAFFSDDLSDATKLTQTISLGVDYGSGPFIGEPTNQLDDITNVESFEII